MKKPLRQLYNYIKDKIMKWWYCKYYKICPYFRPECENQPQRYCGTYRNYERRHRKIE